MSDHSGEGTGIDQRFPAIYDELRRLASAVSRGSQLSTLNPTALVNEAYVKLASAKQFATTSELHFKRIAAKAIRQVLCDAARKRLSIKRGEGAAKVPLDDEFEQKDLSVEQIVLLEDLVEKLGEGNPRAASVVEYRFYGGLTDEEIATELGISRQTVERDWRLARAWLISQFDEQD
jgi:RNA polymerase sigma factor (TIGR02999 family)